MNLPNWEGQVAEISNTNENVETTTENQTETTTEEVFTAEIEQKIEEAKEEIQQDIEDVKVEMQEELNDKLEDLTDANDVVARQNQLREYSSLVTKLKIQLLETEEEIEVLKESQKKWIKEKNTMLEERKPVLPEHSALYTNLYKHYASPTTTTKTNLLREVASTMSDMFDDFDPASFFKSFKDEKTISKKYELPDAWLDMKEEVKKPSTVLDMRKQFRQKQKSYLTLA